MARDSDSLVATKVAAGAPEIEITDEMVEAGVEVILRCVVDEWNHAEDEALARNIFRAMAYIDGRF